MGSSPQRKEVLKIEQLSPLVNVRDLSPGMQLSNLLAGNSSQRRVNISRLD
jgi:hypothetical protein